MVRSSTFIGRRSLVTAELVQCCVAVHLTGPEHHRREGTTAAHAIRLLMDRIRKALRLQTEPAIVAVRLTLLAHRRAADAQEVASVELQPRCGRQDDHVASRGRVAKDRRGSRPIDKPAVGGEPRARCRPPAMQHEAMVVSSRPAGPIDLMNALTDTPWPCEVERSAVNWSEAASGDAMAVDRQNMPGLSEGG